MGDDFKISEVTKTVFADLGLTDSRGHLATAEFAMRVQQIPSFVDSVVPGPSREVRLTESRAKGTARPSSDWDVVAFTPDMSSDPRKLFSSNAVAEIAPGLKIELVIAHPKHKIDPRRYMVDLRSFGIRLR